MEIDLSPLINAGIPGVLLLWFMFRLERLLGRLDKTVQLLTRAVLRLLERQDAAMASEVSKAIYRSEEEDPSADA